MYKQAIAAGALMGAGLGAATLSSDFSPEKRMLLGAGLGAGVEYALKRQGIPLLMPFGAIAGGYFGSQLTPNQPLIGALGGIGLGTLLTGGLKRPRNALFFSLPALAASGILYMKEKAKQEQQRRYWPW